MTRRRKHLTLLQGGRRQEAEVKHRLYPYKSRVVKAEPKPDPNPPRPAA